MGVTDTHDTAAVGVGVTDTQGIPDVGVGVTVDHGIAGVGVTVGVACGQLLHIFSAKLRIALCLYQIIQRSLHACESYCEFVLEKGGQPNSVRNLSIVSSFDLK